MTINTANGGLRKAKSKNLSILWYTEDLSAYDTIKGLIAGEEGEQAYPATVFDNILTSAGAISVDGITLASGSGASDPEALTDWNGNIFDYNDSTDAAGSGTLDFTLLELSTADAMKIAYSEVNSDTEGEITYYGGEGNPVDRVFVIETRIKNKLHFTLIPEAKFNTLGDITYANDELASINVTYSLTKKPDNYVFNASEAE